MSGYVQWELGQTLEFCEIVEIYLNKKKIRELAFVVKDVVSLIKILQEV